MMLLSQYRNKNDELTVRAVRKKYRAVIRNSQLEQIFKAIRANISRVQYYYQPPIQTNTPLYRPITPLLTPENIIYIQQYLSQLQQFPQLPSTSEIAPPVKKQIIETKSIVSSPLKQQNIYFQRKNIRVYNKLIGEGSYSKVWLGVDLRTRKRVAVKQIFELDEDQVKCLKQFTSPYIIKIQQIIKHNDYTYLVLQYCQHNLKVQLEQCNYQLTLVLKYFDQIVEGMDVLQRSNVIHRDLKFQNILLCNGVIKIADFGLARFLGDDLQIESRRCGSPYTMAPQILFSYKKKTQYTPKCDIWSLGILLHLMLYKKHPFNMKKQHIFEGNRIKIKKKFGVLDKLIDECLVKQPRKRIDWNQFKQLYQQYKVNQSRYAIINQFPIETQSIIVEKKIIKAPIYQNNKNQDKKEQYNIHLPNKRIEQCKNERYQQMQRKRISDYNAGQLIRKQQVSKQLPKKVEIKKSVKKLSMKKEQIIRKQRQSSQSIFSNQNIGKAKEYASYKRIERTLKHNKSLQGFEKEKQQQKLIDHKANNINCEPKTNTKAERNIHIIRQVFVTLLVLGILCSSIFIS